MAQPQWNQAPLLGGLRSGRMGPPERPERFRSGAVRDAWLVTREGDNRRGGGNGEQRRPKAKGGGRGGREAPGVIIDGSPCRSRNIAAATGSLFSGGAIFADPKAVMLAPYLKKSKV